jgi:6-phosphogluconate dehydrogenase
MISRVKALQEKGILFVGAGVSGGEEVFLLIETSC